MNAHSVDTSSEPAVANPPRSKTRESLAGLARFPRVLYIGLALALVLIAAWAAPRLAAGYYLYRAGQLLDQAWSDHSLIPCENPSAASKEQRTFAQLAADVATNALRWNPGFSRAQLMHARAACLADQPKEAVSAYQVYLHSHPEDRLAELELGFAWQAAGKLDKAAKAWMSSGQASKDFVTAGQQALTQGDTAKAEIWFQRALAMNPGEGGAWLGIGQIYEKGGQIDQAIDAYQQGMSGGSSASADALIALYQQQGNTEQLVSTLEVTLNQFPAASERLKWWQEWGENLRKTNELSEAINIYNQGLAEYPQDSNLMIGLAYSIFEESNNYEKAMVLLTDSQKYHPTHALSYFAAADILNLARDYQEADPYFLKAINLNPTNSWWQWRRANNARDGENFQLAKEIYFQLIDSDPQFQLSYIDLARLLLEENKPDQAKTWVYRALKTIENPTVWFYQNAAQVLEIAGAPRAAIDVYEKILQINPRNNLAKLRINELIDSIK